MPTDAQPKYRTIPLTKGNVAIVDEADYEWLSQFNWSTCTSTKGLPYAGRTVRVDGKPYTLLMHRLIMGATERQEVDHWDGNRLNNSRDNLRWCTRSQNQQNRGKTNKNTSDSKGVYHVRGRWIVAIRIDGRLAHIGSFATQEEAVAVYKVKAAEVHGKFAFDNRPTSFDSSLVGTVQTPRQRLRSSNTSGIQGVQLHKQTGKYTARLDRNGQRKHIGLFATKEEASDALQRYLASLGA